MKKLRSSSNNVGLVPNFLSIYVILFYGIDSIFYVTTGSYKTVYGNNVSSVCLRS